MAFFGPGQVFRARVNGVLKYFLLANVSDEFTFKEVWMGSSLNGKDWSWEVSSLTTGTVQTESYNNSGEVAHTVSATGGKALIQSTLSNFQLLEQTLLSSAQYVDNARWWGFLNFSTVGGTTQFTRMRVSWASGSPSIQIMTGLNADGDPVYITLSSSATAYAVLNVWPSTIAFGAPRQLRYSEEEKTFELWAWYVGTVESGAYNNGNVNCNTSTLVTCTVNQPGSSCGGCRTGDGSCVPQGQTANAFLLNTGQPGTTPLGRPSRPIWWSVGQEFIEPNAHPAGSTIRYLYSGYEVARMFPFVWKAPNGTRYLFLSTNDLHICTEFLFSPFFKTYVTSTILNWTE